MIKSAYQEILIYKLQVIKQAKLWSKHKLIQQEQLVAIQESYKTPLFNPNLAIRILLFIATLIAGSGASGLVILTFAEGDETILSIVSILFGLFAFVILERAFIQNNHFRSGVTDAITYQACGSIIGGAGLFVDFESIIWIQLVCLIVFAFAAYRYVDIIITLAFIISLAWTIFYHCYEAGGIFKHIIPFVFIISFSAFYFLVRKYRKRDDLKLWDDNLIALEVSSLLLVYAGGNYFVVRELSINLMDLVLAPGEDIPFAWVFYFFTVALPIIYLFAGIRNKNVVLLRMGILTLILSVATFKHYFLPDYTEAFLMVAGGILIIGVIILMRQLKQTRGGFTSENILSSSWVNLNVEAFVISQTMGGNQQEKTEVNETGEGGNFSGGGASGSF
jgi:hypothetical protein